MSKWIGEATTFALVAAILVVFLLILLGTLLYLLKFVPFVYDAKEVPASFELAAIATALGGFILVSAYYRERADTKEREDKAGFVEAMFSLVCDGEPISNYQLRIIATFFLGAAVSFTVFLMLLHVVGSFFTVLGSSEISGTGEWFVLGLTMATLGLACASFALALACLAAALLRGKLLRRR